MSLQLQQQQQQQQQQYHLASLDKDKIELLKRTFCKGATNDELELFIHACNRMNLDPFMRQIHAVKRWSDGKEVMTIQTGIDGYRLIAERTGKYLPGKECTFAYKDNKVFSATAFVKKLGSDSQWHEIGHTVYWEEYASKKKDGSLTGMWRDKPHVMLGKCAEAGVLRKAFPAELSGVYTKEEMEQADVDTGEILSKDYQKPIVQPIIDEVISDEEAQEIEVLIANEDRQYRDDLMKYYTTSRKLEKPMTSFIGFPKRSLPGLMKSINKRLEERAKKKDVVVELNPEAAFTADLF
jgi:phage recombination protein Bet